MRRSIVTAATAAVAAIAGIVGAAPAHAFIKPIIITPATPDQVWIQSFQRADKDAPCVPPASLDIAWQSDWPADENVWTPSWEQWPNGGTGGWTCVRHITWAKGSPAVYRQFI